MNLRFVIDMNLSPAWVERFEHEGWEAVHWSAVGDPRAVDIAIMAHARSKGLVVCTHDLDFSTVLALSRATGPSVIQVRTQDPTPDHIGEIVVDTIRAHASVLQSGALLTIDESTSRVRVLPLGRE